MPKQPKFSKEQDASHKIMQLIQGDAYPIGARLPSERILADRFGTSRNTLRTAMRQLQARGIIDVRSSSGNYILSKEIPPSLMTHMCDTQDNASIAEVMEVRYLVEPVIGAQAAATATNTDIDSLEACLMRMSRASIDNLREEMVREDKHFRRLLALSTKNHLLLSLQEYISSQGDGTVLGSPLPENEKASLFADSVGVFNAVQNRNPQQACVGIQHHVLRQCRLMVDRCAIEMSATVTEALRHLEGHSEDDKPPG